MRVAQFLSLRGANKQSSGICRRETFILNQRNTSRPQPSIVVQHRDSGPTYISVRQSFRKYKI